MIPQELVFPQSCRKTLTSFILSLSANLARKRPADAFIEFTTNSSSLVIVFLNELTAALTASPSTGPAEAIQTYLRLKPQSNLASILDPKHQQRKLQSISDDILETYLDPAVYRCGPVRVFLQKILAHVILETTIQKCARAEWINEWIIYLLEEGEPEIMNVIDAGVEKSPATQVKVVEPEQDAPRAAGEPVHTRKHSRTLSRAEEAMDEAMREAQRLTQMIREEDERREREQDEIRKSQELKREEPPKAFPERTVSRPPTIQETVEMSDNSDSATFGIQTPSSSQSGEAAEAVSTGKTGDAVAAARTEESASTVNGNSSGNSNGSSAHKHFTSFDQMDSSRVPTALAEDGELRPPQETLTLHKARVNIFDDSEPIEKKTIKTKPTSDYLIQIEPASNTFPGWMIPRTYLDFEVLHEVLVRISKITGTKFGELHPTPPVWKNKTKHQLRGEMERYLNDAMLYEQLAESEGMKRFLEKSRGMTASPQRGFWPNPANMGKGMLDALTKAPNHVAGGGKAIIGGVSNVFTGTNANAGNSTANKRASVASATSSPMTNKAFNNSSQSLDLTKHQSARASGESDSPRTGLPSLDVQKRPGMGSRRNSSRVDRESSRSNSPLDFSRANYTMITSDGSVSEDHGPLMKLPPPPDNIADDYAPSPIARSPAAEESISHMSADGTNFFDVPTPPTPRSPRPQSPLPLRSPPARSSIQQPRARASPADVVRSARLKEAEAKRNSPLSESEASVTVELLFAVITELYMLSSAWALRRTLLGAAKTFLLRPGNPQLESIRVLLQETLLDANTSDAGIAAHILKMRENGLPTEEELAQWPKERTPEEKEKLRLKARDLLIKRGMPQALTSVMGQAASGEALAKVFDCLQIESVAKGVMFGLMLQAIRAVSQ